ncbi:hypothetical protein ACLMAJ_15920 [Nocardia sp. KC 131]|uniref:hypothetical protein n=1 Tax=Nocardia arseniciresistens TaxID=3392119 RepID=UPI00398E6DBC
MTAALLAAIAGIVGITIGRLWDTRAESSRWRRDQTTTSYQRVVEQFQVTYEVIRTIALAEPHTDSFQALVHEARIDAFKPWDSAFAAVWLHGSANVVASATALDRAITKLCSDAQERQFTVEDWNQARVPVREAFERFIDSARRQLGLPRAPVRFFAELSN